MTNREPIDWAELKELHRDAISTTYQLIALTTPGDVDPAAILRLGQYHGVVSKLLAEHSPESDEAALHSEGQATI